MPSGCRPQTQYFCSVDDSKASLDWAQPGATAEWNGHNVVPEQDFAGDSCAVPILYGDACPPCPEN